MHPSSPIEYEIRKVARRTVNIIDNRFGAKNACLLGNAASALWAKIKRHTRWVRTVRLRRYRGGHHADSRYYLQLSKKPGANYKTHALQPTN